MHAWILGCLIVVGAAVVGVVWAELSYRKWRRQTRAIMAEYDRRGTPMADRFRTQGSLQTGIPDPPPRRLPRSKVLRRFKF